MTKKVLVLVNETVGRPAPYFERLRSAGFEVVHSGLSRGPTEDELIARLPGMYATIAGGEPYNERVFNSAPDLKVVARWGVGYDHVDVPAATRHGVAIAMAFGANHESVADGAWALMSAVATNLPAGHNQVKAGGWGSDFHTGIWKKTIGILGLGRIGRALARRAKGFDMRVLAYDAKPDAAYAAANGIELVDPETLLREADFVSLHIPQTPENENFINTERLSQMKPTAFLVNTARGSVVDEDALYVALKNRRIAGAALDVFKKEPPIGSPLLTLDNIVLQGHCIADDDTGEHATANMCVDAILAIAEGKDPGGGRVLNPSVIGRT